MVELGFTMTVPRVHDARACIVFFRIAGVSVKRLVTGGTAVCELGLSVRGWWVGWNQGDMEITVNKRDRQRDTVVVDQKAVMRS